MLLDGYLQTRCVELARHLEDLALSVGEQCRAPRATLALAIDLLSQLPVTGTAIRWCSMRWPGASVTGSRPCACLKGSFQNDRSCAGIYVASGSPRMRMRNMGHAEEHRAP